MIEEEKTTGLYHVQLLKAYGKVKKDLNVSPDFLAEVLFNNDFEETEDENEWIWLCAILINVLIFCLLAGGA